MLDSFKAFDEGVAQLKKTLEDNIRVSTLDEVNGKLASIKKSVDFSPLLEAFAQIKEELGQWNEATKTELEDKIAKAVFSIDIPDNSYELADLRRQLKDLSNKEVIMPDFTPQIMEAESRLMTAIASTKSLLEEKDRLDDEAIKKQVKELEDSVRRLRGEIQSKGGGSMNRQILVGGVDPLTRYTDINLKAGSNVILTYSNNDTTKRVDLTIAATGGGGSVGGTIRSINRVSTSQVMGNTSGTDYVYIADAGVKLDLPTASGNTNLYTVKNNSNSSVLVAGTIDDDPAGVIMPIKYTSVDLISNDTNFNIT